MSIKFNKDFFIGMAAMAGIVAVAGVAYYAAKKTAEYIEHKKCFCDCEDEDDDCCDGCCCGGDYVDAPLFAEDDEANEEENKDEE